MPEEIKSFVAPIAVMPRQSILAGLIYQQQTKLRRTRKKEAQDLIKTQIKNYEAELHQLMVKLGRA